MSMLISAIVLAVVLMLDAGGNRLAAAEWCANYDETTSDCSYYTHEECLEAISGVGGYCDRNPNPSPNLAPRRDLTVPVPPWEGHHPPRDYDLPPPPPDVDPGAHR